MKRIILSVLILITTSLFNNLNAACNAVGIGGDEYQMVIEPDGNAPKSYFLGDQSNPEITFNVVARDGRVMDSSEPITIDVSKAGENLKVSWTYEYGEGDCEGIFTYSVVGVTLESVESADHIGVLSDTNVYATAKEEGHVTIKLKSTSRSVSLPNDSITWSGGIEGTSQLERIFSKSTLNEEGGSVKATFNGETVFDSKIYVFEGLPKAKAVVFDITYPNTWTCPTGSFGQVYRGYGRSPSTEYKVYYKDKNWHYVLEKIKFTIPWGTNDNGRTDLLDGTVIPFPLGLNMTATLSEADRRTIAKPDLTPNTIGKPPRKHYWSSAITSKHEKFHCSDFTTFYKKESKEGETWIESQTLAVSILNLSTKSALQAKIDAFKARLAQEYSEASTLYKAGGRHETAAYADGKTSYTNLVQSIP